MTKPQPRYEEIASYLRTRAEAAEPDERLPSDAELCAKFGVSRMTARQAVQVVVNEGLVYRTRGHGTFRAPKRINRILGSPLSFTENMRRRGLTASSKVLEFGTTTPSSSNAEALAISSDSTAIVLERLRFADDMPMAIERAVISPILSSVLHRDVSTGSLHAIFEELGHSPMRVHATVSARRAAKRERDLLNGTVTEILRKGEGWLEDAQLRYEARIDLTKFSRLLVARKA